MNVLKLQKIRVVFLALAVLCGIAPRAAAQTSQLTRVDLAHQAQAVDFSGASYTKPFRSGSAMPATCAQGEAYFLTTASPGTNLYLCTAPNIWVQQSSSSSGQGSASGLAPSANGSILTLGGNCSTTSPCNLRIGSSVYSLVNIATASLTGGTGTAFVYLSSSGALTVGSNLSVTCSSACVTQSGITAFPSDALPIAVWNASNGAWANGTDLEAISGRDVLISGSGLLSVVAGGTTKITTDPALVGLRTAAPATATSVCASGSWAVDSGFYYVCVSANTWRRAALSAW